MQSLGAYIIDEKHPDRDRVGGLLDPTTDQYIEEYITQMTRVDYHPAGSCKMGALTDNTAVVDPQLRCVCAAFVQYVCVPVCDHTYLF